MENMFAQMLLMCPVYMALISFRRPCRRVFNYLLLVLSYTENYLLVNHADEILNAQP